MVKPLIERGALILKKTDTSIHYNDSLPLIPASTLKIATAAAAFSLLGPAYRFQTEFYQNQKGDLIIRGLGDPFLTSEEVALITRELRDRLGSHPGRILVDQSAFTLARRAEGTENSLDPYDAGNAALAVNFNTINIKVGDSRRIASAEPQTPTLPLMQAFGREIGAGEHRISISRVKNGAGLYAGQLFAALLQQNYDKSGRQGPKAVGIFEGKLPRKPVYIHSSSRQLSEVVKAMLLYSNNFIANQLFLTCGARKYGYPATWAKGRRALNSFLSREIELAGHHYHIIEGSGISRNNRLTAAALLQILNKFRPHARLLPQHQGHLLKTGTMTGIYNYAGYLRKDGNLHPLVIMLNQKKNNRDRLLKIVESIK